MSVQQLTVKRFHSHTIHCHKSGLVMSRWQWTLSDSIGDDKLYLSMQSSRVDFGCKCYGICKLVICRIWRRISDYE